MEVEDAAGGNGLVGCTVILIAFIVGAVAGLLVHRFLGG
jgi:hypothetical protein